MEKRFNIEGMNFAEAKAALEENLESLLQGKENGDFKAGRYIGLYYLISAAESGDITSQIALGQFYEFGVITDQDSEEAKKWYGKAIEKDHPKKDGTMLAAAATLGMERLA